MSKSVLMSAPMVRAIREGRKTETRRVMQKQCPDDCYVLDRLLIHGTYQFIRTEEDHPEPLVDSIAPKYYVGDVVYVKESYRLEQMHDDISPSATIAICPSNLPTVYYEADAPHVYDALFDDADGRLRPSIHMPEALARVWLRVTSVRCERLQEIDEDGATAEGIYCIEFEPGCYSGWKYGQGEQEYDTPQEAYEALWESINGAGSWDANPWVWVYGFEVVAAPLPVVSCQLPVDKAKEEQVALIAGAGKYFGKGVRGE